MKETRYVVRKSSIMERKRTNSSEFTPLSSVQSFETEGENGGDTSGEQNQGHRSWTFAAITIVGEIVRSVHHTYCNCHIFDVYSQYSRKRTQVGSGVLGLPYAMKNLGWLLGVAACPIFGLCAAYAGNLLSRAKNSYRPQCRSYVDLAEYEKSLSFFHFSNYADDS